MIKKKLAIVSSYDELCGNAAYTKALKANLECIYDVEVIPLNVYLLRNQDAKHQRLYIKSVVCKLKNFDFVNIQFEAGLFGSNCSSIFRNFRKIASANSNLLLTMHRVDAKQNYNVLKSFYRLGLKGSISHFSKVYANNKWSLLYKNIVNFCKSRNVPILVHTEKDKKVLNLEFKYNNVVAHPLVFYSQEHIEIFKKTHGRKFFCSQLNLNPEDIFIGVLGFINSYKGHLTALEALKFLPYNYKLIIGGAQHPHTIQANQECDKYIKNILDFIRLNKLESRVFFYRFSSDEDFLSAVLNCDFNLLPYQEVGQGGSAVAAIALETKSKSIFTQNFAFLELEKYASHAFPMFSVGNYLELARLILSYRESDYEKGLDNYILKYNVGSLINLYQKFLY